MIPDVDVNRTSCVPCSTCRTCHFNACPVLHGGNPERPGCAHNVPVKAQQMTDTEFAEAQARMRRVVGLRTAEAQMLAESARIVAESDVVLSVTRVEVDENDMDIKVYNRNHDIRDPQ